MNDTRNTEEALKKDGERLSEFELSPLDVLTKAIYNHISNILDSSLIKTDPERYSLIAVYSTLKTLLESMTKIDLARLFMPYLKDHISDEKVIPLLEQLEEPLRQILHKQRASGKSFSEELEIFLEELEKLRREEQEEQ